LGFYDDSPVREEPDGCLVLLGQTEVEEVVEKV
jgi:hypothetical protein